MISLWQPLFCTFLFLVIPSFGGGAGQFGSLGVSWNTALPQHLSSSSSSAAEPSHNQITTISEDVTTPTHHEDDLGKLVKSCTLSKVFFFCLYSYIFTCTRTINCTGTSNWAKLEEIVYFICIICFNYQGLTPGTCHSKASLIWWRVNSTKATNTAPLPPLILLGGCPSVME